MGVITFTYTLCKRFHSNPVGNLDDPDYIKGDDIQSYIRNVLTEKYLIHGGKTQVSDCNN